MPQHADTSWPAWARARFQDLDDADRFSPREREATLALAALLARHWQGPDPARHARLAAILVAYALWNASVDSWTVDPKEGSVGTDVGNAETHNLEAPPALPVAPLVADLAAMPDLLGWPAVVRRHVDASVVSVALPDPADPAELLANVWPRMALQDPTGPSRVEVHHGPLAVVATYALGPHARAVPAELAARLGLAPEVLLAQAWRNLYAEGFRENFIQAQRLVGNDDETPKRLREVTYFMDDRDFGASFALAAGQFLFDSHVPEFSAVVAMPTPDGFYLLPVSGVAPNGEPLGARVTPATLQDFRAWVAEDYEDAMDYLSDALFWWGGDGTLVPIPFTPMGMPNLLHFPEALLRKMDFSPAQ